MDANRIFSFTTEEDWWLNKQLNLIDRVIRLVPSGSDVIKESLKISLGMSPAKDLLPRLLQIFMERVWKLMSLHEEFEELSLEEKGLQFRRVGAAALSLFLLKKETLVCGRIQQFQVKII
jgi:hypothetical protein